MDRNNRRRSSGDDKKSSYRAGIVELFTREIVADKSTSDKIYSRDVDNLYPLRVEGVTNNSPTGRRCANLMAKYIAGNGNHLNFKIGKKAGRDYFINDLLRASATSIAKQYGVYFRVKYILDISRSSGKNIFFNHGAVDVMDYVVMAKSKEDDADYPGKFYKLKAKSDGGILGTDEGLNQWFYAYNSDSAIILEQMHNDCRIKGIESPSMADLISNYRGQIHYLNLTPEYIYALPLADSVYNDMDTEFRIANYNNTQTRTGFLGKTILTRFETPADEEDDFDEEIQSFLGAENSGSVFTVEVPEDINIDLDKAFVVNQLKPQFDDKLFESTVKNIRQNILGAFNNIPEALIFAGSGALFGTNADTYTQMKKFYWEQNEYERSQLEQDLRMLGFDVNILPIVDETILKEEENV